MVKKVVKRIVQKHHIKYKDKDGYDWVVRIYKGEHWAITQLQRRKFISKGFITSLKYWIEQHESSAIDLEEQGASP